MPFVLPELGAAGAAALLALLCMAVVYLIRAIAAALPKISFLFVHIDFGAIFARIVSPVVGLLVNATRALWAGATWWLHAIAWVFEGLFHDVVGVFQAHATQIDYLHNTAIPDVQARAEQVAGVYTNREIAVLRAEIAGTSAALGVAGSLAEVQAVARSEQYTRTAKSALLAVAAHDLAIAERYTNTRAAAIEREITAARHTAHAYTDAQVGALGRRIADELKPPATVPAPGPVALPAPVAAPAPIGLPLPTAGQVLGLAALAGTVATVQTAVQALTSEFNSCAVTSCPGPNNLAGLLKTLLGGVEIASVGAFLAAVIQHPAAAEQEYAGVVENLISGGEDAFHALLSL